MNERQRRFADFYIELGSIEQAAIKAGYSKTYARGNAHKLFANESINNYIKDRMEEKDKERIASQDEVLETLTRVLRGEEEGTELVGVGKGAQRVDQLPPSVEAKIRAAELLGKRYKLWTEKHDLEIKTPEFVEDVPTED